MHVILQTRAITESLIAILNILYAFPWVLSVLLLLQICLSLSGINQPGVFETFNSISKYLDDLLNIGIHYFKQM